MKLKRAIVVILLVVILASSVAALTLFIVEQEASRSAKHGEKLLSAHCAACHAVGRSGASVQRRHAERLYALSRALAPASGSGWRRSDSEFDPFNLGVDTSKVFLAARQRIAATTRGES